MIKQHETLHLSISQSFEEVDLTVEEPRVITLLIYQAQPFHSLLNNGFLKECVNFLEIPILQHNESNSHSENSFALSVQKLNGGRYRLVTTETVWWNKATFITVHFPECDRLKQHF